MLPRANILLLASLALHALSCPAATAAEASVKTIKLDGKVYIPEIKLTRTVTPVTKFLFLGAFEAKGRAGNLQKPMCTIDAKNNIIRIESPERLLLGARTRIVTQNGVNSFLDTIPWNRERRQVTHIAFKIVSARRQPAIIEINTSSDATLFLNGKIVSSVSATSAKASGGLGYFPVTIESGDNIVNIQQASVRGRPQMQMSVVLDHSRDMRAAWQQNGLLKKLVYSSGKRADPVTLDWNPNLSDFRVSLEIRDLATNKTVLQKESVRRGRIAGNDDTELAPGIYEAVCRTGDESASQFFIIGNPDDLFAELRDRLSKYNPDPESKLDIEAQLHRARILLSKENYNVFDRQFQEKLTYTFGVLASMERRLKEGVVNIARDQPGLHIRSFMSAMGGTEHYRLYVPTTYNPANPIPLLVIPSTRVKNSRPFIEGPVMANQREALLWAKAAEQHGFAILWPGYRGSHPEGYSYESSHVNESIQAVERDYTIDSQRINIYATCGAGFNAGRLISEYENRFTAIVYDRAVFDLSLEKIQSFASLMDWYGTINPSRHVLENRNLKIFVMHDNTKPAGHGPLRLTTEFLNRAQAAKKEVVSYLTEQPMIDAARMDMVLSWLEPCRKENPNANRSNFLAKAGYTGPIMEIFTTPILVVEGTHAQGVDMENMQNVAKSFKKNFTDYFHGAQCAVKKDVDVTQSDIDSHSLILLGNPQSNSIWEKLQTRLPVEVTSDAVMYENNRLTGPQPFQAIVRHPYANDKYVLMIGASDLGTLGQVKTGNLFTAWYDCLTFAPRKIISKLSKP